MAPAETADSPQGYRPQSLAARLFAPVDIASLVYFRILFGAILLFHVWTYFHNGWIESWYIRPGFHFTFYGFEWLRPLPGNGMYVLFGILGVLAVFILAGFAYRLSAALFFVGFTYVFLLEEALYQNHYYLVALVTFLMIFVPAHRQFSVDSRLGFSPESSFAPAWSLWILRAQMGLVYFYGAIAKLNTDWLQGWPLRLWLPNDLKGFPILSGLRNEVWLALLFSYSGLLLDLLAVPLLLWKRTRPYMFTALALFHLTNLNLFNIGIFPWLAIAMTALYFEPDWPRRVIAWMVRRSGGSAPPAPAVPAALPVRFRTATTVGIVAFAAIQVLVPLRHWLYPGDVAWTEYGGRFSWRMKLHDKRGSLAFLITDPETGTSWEANIPHYLPLWQYDDMARQPDMLLQFAHYLAGRETRPGHARVEVRAEVNLSLDGRREQPLIDPEVNLATGRRSLGPVPWITPLTAPRRKSLLQGGLAVNR